MINNLLDNQKIEQTIQSIQNVYLMDSLPWVVGYSGGKDSTVLVQVIFNALLKLPEQQRHKKVYIISSDTLVETPLIIASINKTLNRIQEKALELELPIETHKVRPEIEKVSGLQLLVKAIHHLDKSFVGVLTV